MIPTLITEITESEINLLQSAGVQEGTTIEYKQELPGGQDPLSQLSAEQ